MGILKMKIKSYQKIIVYWKEKDIVEIDVIDVL